MMRAVLPGWMRKRIEAQLPDWIDASWWNDEAELIEQAPEAQIGWFDLHRKPLALEAIALARDLQWLSSAYAGVDWMPLADLHARGVVLTCGAGLAASQVAEFAVMSMLAATRGYREIVRAQDRHEWLGRPPSMREMAGSRALILGYGSIGKSIARMLGGFDVECVPVRSQPGPGVLGPNDWRGELGSFDWVVLSLPATPETTGMFGEAEFAAMKDDAWLVNYGRAEVVEQEAMVSALEAETIGGALLDLTLPEPLPPEHRLWSLENAHITMHLCGIPNAASRARAAQRFIDNCERFRAGQPLEAQVDLLRGY
ncbi:D-2-hydroxyacid dehydrogenase [Aurantiacibacter poecillastricola]|uniref:D-2-hydroxyacid dehydrogenase n=1 Tax=Aurantiacibacter poecillastricola TaxID=3064385 RepID=UPI0027400D96|nr:D-2-hydroxyacid dehydrogenase [Aurantiacibacter sp. 219JJ12-13]MDP5262615.1 D-2-hydroxyacid dehydrogenase [Aurantiacibacter sp. 219JJ12-13]